MIRNLLISSIAVLLLAACATPPETSEALAEAQARLEFIENDETTQRYAAAEVDEADRAVERAESTWEKAGSGPLFRHHLYIAQRSLDIAEAQAAVERLDAEAEQLARQRERLRLEARASRAEVAEREARDRAARSEVEATAAAAAAMRERQARERTERERMLAEQRRQEAELEALAAREDAERARQELAVLRNQFAELQAEQTERGLLLTLRDVLFDFNEADLKSGAQRQMAELATYLKQYSERPIRIEGFTDSVGSEEYNQALSEERAEVVEEALVRNGVDPARIVTRGYGEEYPVAGNDTDTGRAQNRRVEIIISYDQQPVQERSG